MEIALERIANMRDGVLDLSNLGLTELPQLGSKGTPSTLKILYCMSNQLTKLPQLVSEDPSTLEVLSCGGNQLTTLPQLPSTLVNLSCASNQLTELPQLPSTLKYLNCSDNQLTSLPQLGSEGTPSTLVDLYCGDNQLTSLPQLVSEDPSTLEDLDCGNNQLTSLPQLPSTLRWMNCQDNPFQYPPADVLDRSIAYIRDWMSENPPTFVKSANKV
jgi:Leucine-rich repeat (LRR) protein